MPSLARWKSLKVRMGRRPISVANLLKKEQDGTLFHKHGWLKSAYELQGEKNFQGLDVAIENRIGSVRKGENEDGTEWSTKFKTPYGYIRGTKGADGEPVDCYVGSNSESPTAYVVRQKDDAGKYDEDTVMLGFNSAAEAKKDILQHYDDSKYVGKVIPLAMERLKELVEEKDDHTKLGTTQRADIEYSIDGPQESAFTARLRAKKGDVPDRDEVDPNPSKVEDRRNSQSTMTVGPMSAAGGTSEVGKFAKALETLGEMDRSWEPASADGNGSHQGQADVSTGGSTRAGEPRAMSEDYKLTNTPFSRTFTDIGVSASQDKEAAAVARAQEHGVKTMGNLDPLHKVARLQEIYSRAFFDELDKIASARGIPDFFEKTALGAMPMPNIMGAARSAGQGLMGGVRSAGQGIASAAQGVAKAFKPAALSADQMAVKSFRQGRGITGFGKDLAAGGKALAHNPQAAGAAAGLGAKDLGALQAMKPTSMGQRITGEVAHGVGHHIEHGHPVALALNPLGAPLGGAMEGLARGSGKELQRSSSAGAQAVGRGLVKHAPKIGVGGEIVAGGMLHAPGLASTLGHAIAPGTHGIIQHAVGSAAQSAHKIAPEAMAMAQQQPVLNRAFKGMGRAA